MGITLILFEDLSHTNLPRPLYFLALLPAIVWAAQWFYLVKYRQVSYNETTLFIKSYFSNDLISIPITDVISLVKKSNLYHYNVMVNYKMVFINGVKQEKIYFYRSLELSNSYDLLFYLRNQDQLSFFIKNTIISGDKTISPTKRLTSAILDHVIMTIVAMIFGLPIIIHEFNQPFAHKFDSRFHFTPLFGISMIGFALYFCKDCICGQSFAKKELKLQVVNNKTGQIANPIRCTVRDLFAIIWPVEVIIMLSNSSRRLGDFVAGTKLIPYDPELERPSLNYFQLALAFLISYCFWIGITNVTGSF
jgi:uncharacterized RDD family membrane protein YckC